MQTGLQSEMQPEMQLGLEKPSNQVIYWATVGSIGLSLVMVFTRRLTLANFIGLWAPSILGLGIYLKENQILELEKRHHRLMAGASQP